MRYGVDGGCGCCHLINDVVVEYDVVVKYDVLWLGELVVGLVVGKSLFSFLVCLFELLFFSSVMVIIIEPS